MGHNGSLPAGIDGTNGCAFEAQRKNKRYVMLWNDYDFIKVKKAVLHLFNSSTHHWSTWSESAKPELWVPARV